MVVLISFHVSRFDCNNESNNNIHMDIYKSRWTIKQATNGLKIWAAVWYSAIHLGYPWPISGLDDDFVKLITEFKEKTHNRTSKEKPCTLSHTHFNLLFKKILWAQLCFDVYLLLICIIWAWVLFSIWSSHSPLFHAHISLLILAYSHFLFRWLAEECYKNGHLWCMNMNLENTQFQMNILTWDVRRTSGRNSEKNSNNQAFS